MRAARFFGEDARGLGKECAVLAGRAVHACGARGLGKQARRLQAARYMHVARGVWKRRRGDSVADKPGNSGWDDVQLLVLALACAA